MSSNFNQYDYNNPTRDVTDYGSGNGDAGGVIVGAVLGIWWCIKKLPGILLLGWCLELWYNYANRVGLHFTPNPAWSPWVNHTWILIVGALHGISYLFTDVPWTAWNNSSGVDWGAVWIMTKILFELVELYYLIVVVNALLLAFPAAFLVSWTVKKLAVATHHENFTLSYWRSYLFAVMWLLWLDKVANAFFRMFFGSRWDGFMDAISSPVNFGGRFMQGFARGLGGKR